MKGILCIAATVFLVSCGHSPLVSHLQDSDSISIRFTEPGTGSVIKVVATGEPYAITDLLQYADSEETEQQQCGNDGKIIFYKKGTVAGEVSFNYTDDGCRHFLVMANGKLTATKMSYQARDLLKSLAGGSK